MYPHKGSLIRHQNENPNMCGVLFPRLPFAGLQCNGKWRRSLWHLSYWLLGSFNNSQTLSNFKPWILNILYASSIGFLYILRCNIGFKAEVKETIIFNRKKMHPKCMMLLTHKISHTGQFTGYFFVLYAFLYEFIYVLYLRTIRINLIVY